MTKNVVVVSSTSDALVPLIEKAVMNQDVDVNKMESLFKLQERAQALEAKKAYIRDFALMQAEFPAIEKRAKTQQSKYATFDDINAATAPARAKYGFALSFIPEAKDGFMTVTATLSHVEGHERSSPMSIPFDTSGNKNAAQAVGSAQKYCMRYCIVALLSISTFDGEDMDAANLYEHCTEGEAEGLRQECEGFGLNQQRMFGFYAKYYNRPISDWSDFPKGSFDTVHDEMVRQSESKKK